MGIRLDYLCKGERKTKGVSLDELFELLHSGKYTKQCNNLQWRLRSGVNLERSANIEDADKLPIARFTISDEGKYTGYVMLSFKTHDEVQNDAIKKAASSLPQTLMCFTGSSGRSVKIIVTFTQPDGTLPQFESTDTPYGNNSIYYHQHAYYIASKFYTAQLGVEPERKSPRIERGCRIGTDADVYLNVKALPIVLEQPQSSLTDSIINGSIRLHKLFVNNELSYADKSLPGYDDYQMAQTKFQYCYRNTIRSFGSFGKSDGSNDLDLFIMALAHECMKNGLSQEFAVKRLLHITPYSNYEMLVRGCFNNIYNVGKIGNDSAIPEPSIEMAQLRDFLKRRYKFRRNSITNQLEYIEEGMYMFDWSALTKEATNRIVIDALMEGIVIWDKDVKRFVESTYINDYDPVHEYLAALPDWDGKDRISELARRVPTANADWERNFHTWMLGMVAQWMGLNKIHGNAMVPLIIGAQGDGKSTFCKLILPEELRNYYTDRLDFANKNDAESRFCLINIDEYDSITKRQTAFLKHILQKTSVMSRQLYSSVITDNARNSAFIATTNDMTPLTDPSGSRRYMCIRTTAKIDTRTPYNYPQIYAQLKAELQQGIKSWFDSDEESAIQLQNRDFEQYDIMQEVFNEVYRKPKHGENGEYLMVSTILHNLHLKYKSLKEDKSNYQKLGRYLMRQSFKHKKMNYGSVYYVKSN